MPLTMKVMKMESMEMEQIDEGMNAALVQREQARRTSPRKNKGKGRARV
jgi:hypothetical protein